MFAATADQTLRVHRVPCTNTTMSLARASTAESATLPSRLSCAYMENPSFSSPAFASRRRAAPVCTSPVRSICPIS